MAPLGDLLLAPLTNGRSVRTREGGFPVLRLTALSDGNLNLSACKPGDWSAEEAAPWLVAEGDFMVSRGNGSLQLVGRGGLVGRVTKPVAFPDTMIRVRPDPEVLRPAYLRAVWHSTTVRTQIERAAKTTAGIYKISQAELRAVSLPLPPPEEQDRIVSGLEVVAPSFALSRRSLRAVDQGLARLRTRVLLNAVAGGDGEGAERGTPTTLGQVLTHLRNGVFVSRPGNVPSGVGILRIGAVRPLALDLNDRRWTGMRADDDRVQPFLLEDGDLLFTRYNGNPDYVGACAVVPPLDAPLVYPDKLIRLRLDPSKAYPPYVAMACSVGRAREFIQSRTRTTAGQAGIAGRDLREVPLVLPPVAVQKSLWVTAQESLSRIDRLRDDLVRTSGRLEAVHASTLRLAMTGGLVPPNAGEEPAGQVLLRRLAERSGATTASRGKQRTVRNARAARAPKHEETTA